MSDIEKINYFKNYYSKEFDFKLKDLRKGLKEFILNTLAEDFLKKEYSIKNFELGNNLLFIDYKDTNNFKDLMSFHYKDFTLLK